MKCSDKHWKTELKECKGDVLRNQSILLFKTILELYTL